MRPVSGPYSCLKLVPLLMGPLWLAAPGQPQSVPMADSDPRLSRSLNHVQGEVFFWFVAAWVKSRAERPSVSEVN